MSATSGTGDAPCGDAGGGGERDVKRARIVEAPAPQGEAPSPRFLLLGGHDEALSMLESILSAGGGELARGVLGFLRRYEAAPLAEASGVCRAAVEGAERVRMLTLISRCRQGQVSVLEAALGVSGASILNFLRQGEARPLRVVSRPCREAVAEHVWSMDSWYWETTRITGNVASWRRGFPRATHANMWGRLNTSDADMVHLSGIHTLDMSWCSMVTDAGLAHQSGIHTKWMSHC